MMVALVAMGGVALVTILGLWLAAVPQFARVITATGVVVIWFIVLVAVLS